MTDAPAEPEHEPDDALVVRAKTDRAAFGELFDRMYPRVARYCWRRLGDSSQAEDVTSEVFLQIASRMATFEGRGEADFRRWVFRIATNAVAAHRRQAGRRAELWQSAARGGRFERAASEHASAAEYDRLDWPSIRGAMEELSERDQTIVSLRFFADCSHQEIAAVLDLTVGAVRTALTRALARLREKLDGLRPGD
jgi:RNA polymerase sigma-70 factor (ECF subfamily)